MIEFMVAAPASGSGKTVMSCALLALLKKRGFDPCAFKCGPDYIDPMFHRAVLGVESHNLDLFLAEKPVAKALYRRYAAGHGAAVCEGAMGYYDGVGGSTTTASAWAVADALAIPTLLVVRPKGASLTLAASIKGLQAFRPGSRLAGLLLNDCTAMQYRSLAPLLEAETGLPVLGYLPHTDAADFASRHLGLYTAGEIENLAAKLEQLGEEAAKGVDLPRLLALCGGAVATQDPVPDPVPDPAPGTAPATPVSRMASTAASTTETATLAVAQDEAFCFTYAETLDALRQAGARLQIFSP
ncbi:MAG: cobyrinate a,c-diamide synthase, partial [Gemmiger sp.]|nr:cobyrinate a,c-diamide synthase [Gemmiger sp.]